MAMQELPIIIRRRPGRAFTLRPIVSGGSRRRGVVRNEAADSLRLRRAAAAISLTRNSNDK